MHRIAALALLVTALTARGAVTFVSPLEGSQAIGASVIHVTTDAARVDRVDFLVDGVLAGVAREEPYAIAFDFGTSLAARTVEAKVWSGGFTTFESAKVTTAAMTANDTIDVDLVEVPVRVRTAKTLTPDDLRVRENGIEQTIRDVKRERPPAHFAFVVDRSLSMNDGKLDAALRAVESHLARLREGDTASLVLFNHLVAKPRPLSRTGTLSAGVTPSGGTSLRDALASAASNERTYAIVITDGGDRNSELSDEEALRKISGTKIIVNAIVLGSSHARFLDRAASNTGGSVVAASKSSLDDTLSRLLADINSRYLIVYQSSGTKRGWRTVEVKGKHRGIEIVSARRGYFAE